MPEEREVKIKEIIQRTHNVKSFRLEVDEKAGFKAGQFMSVSFDGSKELTRYLSISNSPTEKGYLECTKKITGSEFSKKLNSAKVGDILKIKYPLGNFTLQESFKKVTFLSGGIGITPIRSMVKNAVDERKDIDIILIYGNHSAKDIAFKDDFEAIQKESSAFKVVHVLCESEQEWRCKIGHIDAGVIKEEVSDYSERTFYLCGPPGMVEAMKRILLDELAVAKENIITENFAGY
ncbi:ferredoxin--NADP reductase [Candidatus Omnitrophota bacterium]